MADGKEKPSSILDDPFIKYKLAKQVCLISIWAALGFMLEVIGPTMQDLMEILDVNYQQISLALIGKSTGFFIGSLLGGFLHEIFHSKTDLIMSVGIAIGAVGIAFVPWSSGVGMCAFLLGLTGVSEGFINTGGNTMVMDLWQDQATGPMHSLHFGFGIGAILVPQLSRPFLSKGINPCENVTDTATCATLPSGEEYRESNLDTLYFIVAAIILLAAIAIFIFFIVGPPKGLPKRESTSKIKKLLSPATCAAGDFTYGTALMVLLFLYFVQATGGERAAGKFLASFAVDAEVGFTKDEAATLLSVFWFCHMCGRFSGIFIGHFVAVQKMIVGEIIGVATVSVVLAIWGYNTATVLWVFSGLLGFFISFLFPSGMSWGNVYMDVNSMGVMVFLLGASVGGYIYQYLPGYLFEEYGPRSLTYVFMGYSVLIALVYIIMSIFVNTYKVTNVYHIEEGMSNDRLEDESKCQDLPFIVSYNTDSQCVSLNSEKEKYDISNLKKK